MPVPLNEYVLARFREAFGEHHNGIASDHHWALQPKHADSLPINVLVNGGPGHVVIWVFDANEQPGKTLRTAVNSPGDADQMIAAIQNRLVEARGPCGPSGSGNPSQSQNSSD